MGSCSSDTYAVRVRGLRKSYAGATAVDGIDLDVRRGEVLALLGPNGAGKTTTVEVLEGHRYRDGGEVRVLGRDPAQHDAAWRSRIGIVLQSSRGLDELTAEELVRHFAGYYPRPWEPDALLRQVGLEAVRRTRSRHLSGGQRRRLDVALGIVGRPELLFLDEPTTGFDPEARHEMWRLVAGLAADGTTILLTTHDLDEAEHLADRVAVMVAGRVVAVDTPEGLGGRRDAAATVHWVEPGDGLRETLTTTPARTVAELAARFDGEVPGLTVHRPTLEDIYLRLVSRP